MSHLSLAAFITSMLPNISFDLWIGLHDAQGEFQWAEGEPLRHVNWAPGEPSGCSSFSPREEPVRDIQRCTPIPQEDLSARPSLGKERI